MKQVFMKDILEDTDIFIGSPTRLNVFFFFFTFTRISVILLLPFNSKSAIACYVRQLSTKQLRITSQKKQLRIKLYTP